MCALCVHACMFGIALIVRVVKCVSIAGAQLGLGSGLELELGC